MEGWVVAARLQLRTGREGDLQMRRDVAFPETIASGMPPAEIVVATAARFAGLGAYDSAGALMFVKGFQSVRAGTKP